MNYETQRKIPSNHPSLAGHFPNNPIVPGAVILDEVIQVLQQWKNDYQVTSIPITKFLKPLQAEQQFSIKLKDKGSHQVKFVCTRENEILAQGQLKITPKHKAA